MTTDPADTCPPVWNTSTFFQSATPETIRACVSAGESVNAPAPDGWTPLHFAAPNTDDPAVIRALIDRRAQVSDLCGQVSDVQLGITPLHLAVQHNANPDVAEVRIQAGADVNSHPLRRNTPLCLAARRHMNAGMIRLLLRHGAEVGGAARCAAREADATAMSILIEAGADLAGVLHLSILSRMTPVTELVIAAGADPNEPMTLELQDGTTEGNTPLHLAARAPAGQVNLEAVELLLVAGADPNRRDSTGRTPLDWAEARGQTSLAALLREYGGKPGG